MKTTTLGREIIEAFEGCLRAVSGRPGLFTTYRDEVGVLTIGYGHTNLGSVPPRIYPGMLMTQADCDSALSTDLGECEALVMKATEGIVLDDNKFSALVSFEFNTGHLEKSSILPKLRAGDETAAMQTLEQYTHAGHQVLAGLVRRRQSEAALFFGQLQKAATIADVHIAGDDVEKTAMVWPDFVEAA